MLFPATSSLFRGALVLSLGVASVQVQAQVEFPVSFQPSADVLTEEERSLLTANVQAAGRRWAQFLGVTAARSIEVEIGIQDIPRANGASVTSRFVAAIDGRNMFEQAAAFELRTGEDPNGDQPDVRFNFSTDYLRNELWLDPEPHLRSAPVPENRTDAFSVLLHEFGHAFAFNGWSDGQGNLPETFMSSFDRWILAGGPPLFDGPVSVQMFGGQPELTVDNVHHWGNAPAAQPKAHRPRPKVEWKNAAPVPQPACEGLPSVDAPPSMDRLAMKQGTLNLLDELMNGVVFYRGIRYDITELSLAAFDDVGLPQTLRIFVNGFEAPEQP